VEDQFTTWISTGAAALSAVIGVLYRNIMQMHRDQQTMLRNQADIREEIGKLKGQQTGIEKLSADVLETVHNVLNRHKRTPNKAVDTFRNDTKNQNFMPNHGREYSRRMLDDED
jgi:hypothetical protein